jgi:calcium-dependent protein kinase
MAPEVIKRDYNEKCDLWACGVILYVVMCGYPPFRAQTLKALQLAICAGKYDFKDACWQEVTPETKDLIKKLLVIEIQRRLSAREALSHPFFQ